MLGAFFYLITGILSAGTLDVAGSEIAFEAQSRLAAARGVFRQWAFSGSVEGEESAGEIRISVCSLDTANGMRDNHLRGPDFFDCNKFPEAVFRLGHVKGRQVAGTLTLKGLSNPVACEADQSAGFIRGRCVLDRRDFGIAYQSALNPISPNVAVVFALRVR